jgi:hypothetical protein
LPLTRIKDVAGEVYDKEIRGCRYQEKKRRLNDETTHSGLFVRILAKKAGELPGVRVQVSGKRNIEAET